MPAPHDPEITGDLTPDRTPRTPPSRPGRTPLDPGLTIASRYRIVSRLGQGGMGEVFRADDLELNVTVALKFLPPSLAADPARLDRLRAEVRLARQISHPNICRVFDIGQAAPDGAGPNRAFITMEYVDGEDLASLLRRIGRLPTEKALEVARQLCLGLAAAHEQRVVHRDLKPANIMIDARGRAHIMDFGVAAAAGESATGIAGTPAYMSPEQAEGASPTTRSDLFSLGLVLYELFTGKPCVPAATPEKVREFHRTQDAPRPSTLVPDIDPAAERIIMRCLERDPAQRPPSAIAVLTSLPGTDPLAAALAAGQTPSPELVAASGGKDVLRPRTALAVIAASALMLAAVVLLMAPSSILGRVPPPKPREVLIDKATEFARTFGYDHKGDFAVGHFVYQDAFIQHARSADTVAERWRRLSDEPPGPYAFWLRQSPSRLRPQRADRTIEITSPFPSTPGETVVKVDQLGHLEYFLAVPNSTKTDPTKPAPEPDWPSLFRLSDLDIANFTPETPDRRPLVTADVLHGWTGSDPAHPDRRTRIVAAASAGSLTYWRVAHTWPQNQDASAPAPAPPPEGQKVATWFDTATQIALDAVALAAIGVLVAAAYLAYRNLRLGRGDRAGATRVALVLIALGLLRLALVADRFPSFGDVIFVGEAIGAGEFLAILWWLLYLALEPYARRSLPETLVGWTRLVRGRFLDPLVGRDALYGLTLGSLVSLTLAVLGPIVNLTHNQPLASPDTPLLTRVHLFGPGALAGKIIEEAFNAAMFCTSALLVFVMVHMFIQRHLPPRAGFLRKKSAHLLGLIPIIVSVARSPATIDYELSQWITIAATCALLLTRGLLPAVICLFVVALAALLPVGTDWTLPTTRTAFIPAAILASLALWGYIASTGTATRTAPAT